MLIPFQSQLHSFAARLLLVRGESAAEPSVFSFIAAGVAMVVLSQLRRTSDTDTD